MFGVDATYATWPGRMPVPSPRPLHPIPIESGQESPTRFAKCSFGIAHRYDRLSVRRRFGSKLPKYADAEKSDGNV